MSNAGRHQATGRGRRRQVLPRRQELRARPLYRSAASTRRSERKHGQPPAYPHGKVTRPPAPYLPASVRHTAPVGHHAAQTADTRTPTPAPPTQPGREPPVTKRNWPGSLAMAPAAPSAEYALRRAVLAVRGTTRRSANSVAPPHG